VRLCEYDPALAGNLLHQRQAGVLSAAADLQRERRVHLSRQTGSVSRRALLPNRRTVLSGRARELLPRWIEMLLLVRGSAAAMPVPQWPAAVRDGPHHRIADLLPTWGPVLPGRGRDSWRTRELLSAGTALPGGAARKHVRLPQWPAAVRDGSQRPDLLSGYRILQQRRSRR
jgi:hypothetical protein